VELVFTERRDEVASERARNFERLLEQVVDASGLRVQVAHYERVDPRRLANADAIVLSGSTAAWATRGLADVARLGAAVLAAQRPVLGICAGMQLLTCFAGGSIALGVSVEHGFLPVRIDDRAGLLRDLPDPAVVFHDHTDAIVDLAPGFEVLARSEACAVQAFADPARRWYGTQFHPEESTVEHPDGRAVLGRFFELAAA
jgi:GMP synthase-like glutamine amidotransferase